jgi:hypothetical protein
MMRVRSWLRPVLILPVLLVPACSGSEAADVGSGSGAGEESSPARSRTQPVLQEATAGRPDVVPGTTGPELAAATSAALYASAPVVVLAGADDLSSQGPAASVAVALGAPLLLAPPTSSASSAVVAEIDRLSPQAVLALGRPAQTWAAELDDVEVVAAAGDAESLQQVTGAQLGAGRPVPPEGLQQAVAELSRSEQVPLLEVERDVESTGGPGSAPEPAEPSEGQLPRVTPPEPAAGTVVLTIPDPAAVAAVATARAAGADVVVLPAPDPRAHGPAIERLAAGRSDQVLGLGGAFGPQERFADRVAVASTGVQLPGGGQLVLPGKRYVALYGHPGSKALGVLGEQGPDASVDRAVSLAAEYAAVRQDVPVVPTFEIITTIADAVPGPDGDYSAEATIEHLLPHVEAAGRSGVYVVLDLQPGYTDFLTQAKRYEELLALPHVGLALDPEWRLAPGQRHMQQIGRVGADEVNAVGDWLAELVRERRLPQKMLLLHQFKVFMLEERERIVADREELAVVTQMDGHGPPSTKNETWNIILRDPPAGMTFGWKNFYDEDSPTLTPAQTLAVEPTPVFISYQ